MLGEHRGGKLFAMMRGTDAYLGFMLFICASIVTGSCTGRTTSASSTVQPADFREGDIIETVNGNVISFEELTNRLVRQEVVYLGEEHHNRYHIDAALSLLNALSAAGRRPVVAMEMFGWDGQALLDRYIEGDDLSRQEFLSQVGWTQTWGGPFESYEPLVAFAKQAHVRVVALNPPKSLVKLVARNGLEHARRDAVWTRWNMQDETIADDPPYRQKIFEQLRACHGGGSDAMYQTMYEASMVRDEGMARTIAALLTSMRVGGDALQGPVVSYTGGGHVQYNLPVPNRVARRLSNNVRQSSVYMASYEQGRQDDLREMLAGKIADYLWLTPVSADGMPRRCR